MSEIVAVTVTIEPTPPIAAVEVTLIPDGRPGKDQYQSYLDTTTDDPPLTEEEWAAGGGGGGTTLTNYSQVAALPGYPASFPPTIGGAANQAVAGNDARLADARHLKVVPLTWESVDETSGQIHMTGGDYEFTTRGTGTEYQAIPTANERIAILNREATSTLDLYPLGGASADLTLAAGESAVWLPNGSGGRWWATSKNTAAMISDATAAGRALLTAADAAAQRTALGGGATGQSVFQAATVAAANLALNKIVKVGNTVRTRSINGVFEMDEDIGLIALTAGLWAVTIIVSPGQASYLSTRLRFSAGIVNGGYASGIFMSQSGGATSKRWVADGPGYVTESGYAYSVMSYLLTGIINLAAAGNLSLEIAHSNASGSSTRQNVYLELTKLT